MTSLLSVRELSVGWGRVSDTEGGAILRGVDLSIEEGECLALVGESGCGKSMTALAILNLLPTPPLVRTGGEIFFKGRNLSGLTGQDWRGMRGREIGIVFQEPLTSLNPVLRIGDQIEEVVRIHSDLSPERRHGKVLEILGQVGLPDGERISRQYPHQLSGGMCQRVMLAMAIVCGPSLLIADEPTTALDVTVQAQILELLFEMKEKRKLALLFITHDLRLARGHADRVAVLYAGQVVEEGTPSEIFSHPRHPYTEGLIESLPEYSQKGRPLFNIGGKVPTPFDRFEGCAFADRCPRAQADCRSSKPEFMETTKGHSLRCFYPSKR